MLFLYRPRETWMPFARPLSRTPQATYNRQLQQRFDSTRRVAPAVPSVQRDVVGDMERLGELHRTGVLTETEFESAKAQVLAG